MRAFLLLMALSAATPALAGSWVAAEGTSADMPYAGLALSGSTAVPTNDGGMRLVTFWTHVPPADPAVTSGGDPQAVMRCVTDLGPDLAVVEDRCWQSAP